MFKMFPGNMGLVAMLCADFLCLGANIKSQNMLETGDLAVKSILATYRLQQKIFPMKSYWSKKAWAPRGMVYGEFGGQKNKLRNILSQFLQSKLMSENG